MKCRYIFVRQCLELTVEEHVRLVSLLLKYSRCEYDAEIHSSFSTLVTDSRDTGYGMMSYLVR